MAERILKNFENKLEFYSLNNPGIPFLADGEKLQLSRLAKQKLVGKMGEIEEERFIDRSISNIVYHEVDGSWVNGSWVVDVFGFDQSIFDQLTQPHSTTVQLLPIDKELAQVSGSSQMVQIGFNVGGGELVFKRILLPPNYRVELDWQEKVISFSGTKMPDVFVAAWDNLKVDTVDQIWHDRVREQLLGNSRDMGKRIEYQMINGEKWITWNGAKIWAGLLSDKRDIERFLAEEQALVNLKPGEFMVAKYTHGGSGAISAATSQEMNKKDKPKIVGDVQMMGEDGTIYQAAVEDDADQIDELIGGLVAQLHLDHNLLIPESVPPLLPWLQNIPVLPISIYPMKFLIGESKPGIIAEFGFSPFSFSEMPASLPSVVAVSLAEVSSMAIVEEFIQTESLLLTDYVYQLTEESQFSNDDSYSSITDWEDNDGGSDGDKGVDSPSGGGLARPAQVNSEMPAFEHQSLVKIVEQPETTTVNLGEAKFEKQQLKVTVVEDRCCFPKKRILEKAETAMIVFESAVAAAVVTPTRLDLEGYKSQEEFTDKEEVAWIDVDTLIDERTEKCQELITTSEIKLPLTAVFEEAGAEDKPTRLDLEGLGDRAAEPKVLEKIEEEVIYPVPIYQPSWQPVAIKDIPEWVWQGTAADPDEIIDWPWFLATMLYALLNTKVLLKIETS